ncbi:Coagulation factor XII [Picochlorum sp. SENEW3]|nr:Coagulation factor XII [Picochlorum sp. SENEW3]
MSMEGGRVLVALLCLVATAAGCSEGPEARFGGVAQAGGRAAHRSILQSVVERVSGGKDAQKGDFPWMARIDLPQGSCGGILVTPSQVLTAAHCLEPFDRDDVLDDARVSIGQGDSGSCRSCETFRIDSYTLHPGYKPEGFNPASGAAVRKDLAIIELDDSSDVRPAQIAKMNPRTSDKGIVLGWGETETESESDTLKYSPLRVVPDSECDGFKPKNYFDSKSSICTAPAFSNPGPTGVYTSACEGDSGGPLMASDRKATVWGIVSYSIRRSASSKCGDMAHTVFTSLPDSFDWLMKNLDLGDDDDDDDDRDYDSDSDDDDDDDDR